MNKRAPQASFWWDVLTTFISNDFFRDWAGVSNYRLP